MKKSGKKALSDLAIFGGTPEFGEKLHTGRPNLGERHRFLERVNDMLDRRWLTNDGPYAGEFERRVAALVGVRHCIATSSGTVALQLATRAAGMTGEVIVPSMTFVATAHALSWQGMTPAFCDIDLGTHNISPSAVRESLGVRTTGILAVHLWGRPCQIEELEGIARERGLPLVFDASHAFACSYKGRMVGGFGDAEVFSFHATKFVNCFEGGAVVTNHDALAARVRSMKNFGFTAYDEVSYPGTNGKMSEVAAAMGLTSLESLDRFVAVNRRNHEEYQRQLAGVAGVSLVTYDPAEKGNFQYVVLEVALRGAGLDRDALVQILQAENVLARRYFYPGCHRMEPYRSVFPDAGARLPNTEQLAAKVVCLPTGTAIGTEEVERICGVIRFATARGEEVRERLSGGRPVAGAAQ